MTTVKHKLETERIIIKNMIKKHLGDYNTKELQQIIP